MSSPPSSLSTSRLSIAQKQIKAGLRGALDLYRDSEAKWRDWSERLEDFQAFPLPTSPAADVPPGVLLSFAREVHRLSQRRGGAPHTEDGKGIADPRAQVVAAGEEARDEVICHAYDRVRRLAQTLLSVSFPALTHEVSGTEVADKTVTRIMSALNAMDFKDTRAFFSTVAQHVRYVLLDLVDNPPEPVLQNSPAPLAPTPPATDSPLQACYRRLHEAVNQLEEGLREVIEYRFFLGFSVAETAERLGVVDRTVQNRSRKAIVELGLRLKADCGEFFGRLVNG